MINIITKSDLLQQMLRKNKKLKFVKLPFKRYETVLNYEGGISKEVLDIITIIEESKIDSDGNLESKFSNTPISLNELSDGSKTVMYIYYRTKVRNENEIINITECGPNAIEYILKKYSDADLNLYLEHLEFPANVNCNFKINNNIVSNTNEIFE